MHKQKPIDEGIVREGKEEKKVYAVALTFTINRGSGILGIGTCLRTITAYSEMEAFGITYDESVKKDWKDWQLHRKAILEVRPELFTLNHTPNEH